MAERGIGNEDKVIVYDANGLSSAGRAWWMLRLFGHDNVALLDGGLPKWKAEGRPLETAAPTIPERRFTAHFDPALVRAKSDVLGNVATKKEQVVDARSAGRFDGSAEETWPGRRRGHIPGSRNLLLFDQVTDPVTKQLKPADQLAGLFAGAGVALDRPIVASCGSGVTACALAFAAYLIGHDRVAVYDGSWSGMGPPRRPADRDRSSIVSADDAHRRSTVTYLEMFERPPARALSAPPARQAPALLRAENCTVSLFYRYLYQTVGTPWVWFERRLWSDAAPRRGR